MSLLALMAAAQIVAGGAGYAEAEKRALDYDKDLAGNAWDAKVLAPELQAIPTIMRTCGARVGLKTSSPDQSFSLVISFEDGVFTTVFADRDTPLARCVAGEVANMPLTNPPMADYAEILRLKVG